MPWGPWQGCSDHVDLIREVDANEASLRWWETRVTLAAPQLKKDRAGEKQNKKKKKTSV